MNIQGPPQGWPGAVKAAPLSSRVLASRVKHTLKALVSVLVSVTMGWGAPVALSTGTVSTAAMAAMAATAATPGAAQPSEAAAASQSLRFAPERAYPPFVYEDSQGRVSGLSVDILRALEPSIGVPVQWLAARPLAEILQAARAAEVDLISSLRPNAERSEYLSFTQPYVTIPAVLLTLEADRGADLSSMSAQTVAVGKGYAVEAHVRARYPQVHWVALSDDEQALLALRRGEVRALVADVGSVLHLLQREGREGVWIGGPIGFDYTLSFAYRKERSDIGRRLDQALREFDPNRRREIVSRWLDPEALAWRHPRRQWWQLLALGLLGFSALAAAVWAWRMRGHPSLRAMP